MRKLKNTNELNVNDLVVLVPRMFICDSDTKIEKLIDDKCYRIELKKCDIESFGECVEIGKVISVNFSENKILIRDIRTGEDCTLKFNVEFRSENENEYSAWVF